jgi:hypothetical protein
MYYNTNLWGRQDERVFDGAELSVDPGRAHYSRSPAFKEDLLTWNFPSSRGNLSRKTCRVYGGFVLGKKRPALITPPPAPLSGEEEVYGALGTGPRAITCIRTVL